MGIAIMQWMGTLHPRRRAAALRDAVYVGLRSPPRRLAKIENIVGTMQLISRLTPLSSLCVSPVLSCANDGTGQILIALRPRHSPANALTASFLVAVDAPSLSGTASPRQRLRKKGAMAVVSAIVVSRLNADRVPIVLRDNVGGRSLPRPSVTLTSDAEDT